MELIPHSVMASQFVGIDFWITMVFCIAMVWEELQEVRFGVLAKAP